MRLNPLYRLFVQLPATCIIIVVLIITLIGSLVYRYVFLKDYVPSVEETRYVMYTSDSVTKPVKCYTIVDTNTEFKYLVFEVDGQYVCVTEIE